MRALKDPAIERALRLLVETLEATPGIHLASVVLYGSIVFDDLAPGYGDLDFLAVTEDAFPKSAAGAAIAARGELRSGRHGVYAEMLEGAILPPAMLDPYVEGLGVWWGTTKERTLTRNVLGPLVLHVIRERGCVVWGADVRDRIPPPTDTELLQDVSMACRSMFEHGRGGSVHSVDWLLTAARLLLFLREGKLSSKSEAADWGTTHVDDSWRGFLAQAKETRLHPAEASQAWLDSLDGPIRAAAAELSEAVSGLETPESSP